MNRDEKRAGAGSHGTKGTETPGADSLLAAPNPHFGLDIPFMHSPRPGSGLVRSGPCDRAAAAGTVPREQSRRLSRRRADVGARLHPERVRPLARSTRHWRDHHRDEHALHRGRQSELTIESRLIRRGARIAFCEGTITDAEGELVCLARAAFKLVPRRPGDVIGAPASRPPTGPVREPAVPSPRK